MGLGIAPASTRAGATERLQVPEGEARPPGGRGVRKRNPEGARVSEGPEAGAGVGAGAGGGARRGGAGRGRGHPSWAGWAAGGAAARQRLAGTLVLPGVGPRPYPSTPGVGSSEPQKPEAGPLARRPRRPLPARPPGPGLR